MAAGKFLNDATVNALGIASVDGTLDYFPVHDASATELKKIQAADVLKRLLSSADVSWMSSLANLAAVDSANDKFAVWDASAAAWKLLTATEILDRLLTTLDPAALPAFSGGIGSIDDYADFFLIWDASAGVFKTLMSNELVKRLWRGAHISHTTTPVSLAATEYGWTFSNTGAVIPITYNLPPATAGGLRYSFNRVAPYNITLDPSGSETINGALTYTLTNRGRVDIECFVTGEWLITQDSTGGSVVQEDFTSNDTLTAAESGKTCTNIGASATVTLTAPAATAGMEFTIVRSAAFALRFDPSGTEIVRGGGAGKYVELQGYGAITFRCLTAGVWEVWNDAAPWNFEP